MIDPNKTFPLENTKRLCFLKNIINTPNIIVGDYTYYDDPNDINNFMKNVLYHFDFVGDKLIIGKFCQIATGTRFIMNGGNHAINGFSTFPFAAFGGEWSQVPLQSESKGIRLSATMFGLVIQPQLCQVYILVMVQSLQRIQLSQRMWNRTVLSAEILPN